ncbi:hypothetical protein [Kitasatospora aureofaciens]|uniref:hypothetical protein n=1 Tax=Kitasatospora aureofaciens TaxID=1894 RepID=UPI0038143E93
MLTIPNDLDRWHSNQVASWLTDLANDETVTDDEYRRAEAAAHEVLVGTPAEQDLP